MDADTQKVIETEKRLDGGSGEDAAAAAVVVEEFQIPSLPLVLRTLDNLSVKADGAEIAEKEVTDEVRKSCPVWHCRRNEAQRLIRQLLEEGEMRSKCHSSPTRLGFWKFGKRPDDQVRDDLQEEKIDEGQKTTTRQPELDRIQPTICQNCHEKNKDLSHVGDVDSLNSKEIMALITKSLKNDEIGTKDVHCLCNKCLGIKSDSHLQTKCRRQTSSFERSAQVERNMELLRRHHQRKSERDILYKKEKEKRKKSSKKKKRKSKSTKSGKSGKKATEVSHDEKITKESIEIATFKEQQGITGPEKIALPQGSIPPQADAQNIAVPDFEIGKPLGDQVPRVKETQEPVLPQPAEGQLAAVPKEGGSSKSEKKKRRAKKSETPSEKMKRKKRKKKRKSGKKDAAVVVVSADLGQQPPPAQEGPLAGNGETMPAVPSQPTAADDIAERATDLQSTQKSKKKRRRDKKEKKKEQ
uniref:Uncharacterized protein n=1 Tax=Romanomermis culicivorax TaxID=13658 RepID=A0A915KNC6_ROMCU